jgi:hypothetical protein
MRSYWLNPSYWLFRRYMKQYVELIECKPWLMDNPQVRANLAELVADARRLGWE